MKKLTDDNFDSNVLESKNPVLVDFWSEFCMQCTALEPTIKKLEDKYPNIEFYSANINDVVNTARQHGIMSLPTVIIFKDGKTVHQFHGNLPIDIFEMELNKV